MSEELNDVAAEAEDEASGRNAVVIGVALLLLGFAAGAIAAALMTPKTGKQMRRQLRRKLDDARDSMGGWSEQAGDIRERAAEFAGKAQEWAGAAREAVEPIAKKFRS
jgi:gas vesicle protein